jgi:FkbM family methyltransferase
MQVQIAERDSTGRATALLQQLAITAGRALRSVHVRGIPRLCALAGPRLFGPRPLLVPSVAGPRIAVDLRDYNCCMMLFGRYAPELLALLGHVVRAGDAVLDVGAQVGYITVNLARRVGPTGSVHSFEPDPSALPYLRAAVAANGQSWVRIFECAAADRDGELTFHVSRTLGWSTAAAHSHHRDLRPITVCAQRIDSLAARGEISRPVRLVKLDVEGFECATLDGMRELIDADRPIIVTELNPLMLSGAGFRAADLLARLERHDYQLFRFALRGRVYRPGPIDLQPVGAAAELGFCDLLCVPREAALTPRPGLRIVEPAA